MPALRCTVLIALAALAWPAGKATAGDIEKVSVEKRLEQARIVVVHLETCCALESWTEAVMATVKELTSLGVKVHLVPGRAQQDEERRLELSRMTSQRSADCAVRVVRRGVGLSARVDLWCENPETSERLCRSVPIADKADGFAATVAALKVVEQVSAALEELDIRGNVGPMPESGEKTVNKGAPTVYASDFEPGMGFRVGAGALGATGGIGAVGTTQASIRFAALEELSFELDVTAGLLAEDIAHDGSKATFDLVVIRAWGLWEPYREGTWRPAVGIGAGAAILWSRGLPGENQVGVSDSSTPAYLGVGGQLAVVLTDWLALRLEAKVGLVIPDVDVRFGTQDVARFGPVVAEGALGLELTFF